MRVWFFCFLMLLCTACHQPSTVQHSSFVIHLSADSQSIYISGIDYATIQQLKHDSLTTENWQGIFPVYKMPADTDLKDFQREQPGVYRLTDTTVVFKPDSAFTKNQLYVARFYGTHTFISAAQVVRKQASLKGPAFIEKTFKR